MALSIEDARKYELSQKIHQITSLHGRAQVLYSLTKGIKYMLVNITSLGE